MTQFVAIRPFYQPLPAEVCIISLVLSKVMFLASNFFYKVFSSIAKYEALENKDRSTPELENKAL